MRFARRPVCRRSTYTASGTALAYQLHEIGVAPANAAAVLGHDVQTHLAVYVFARIDAVRSAADLLGQSYAS